MDPQSTLTERGAERVLQLSSDGPLLRGDQDALDLIGEAWGADATWVLLPLERLPPECLTLRDGLLGALFQRVINYRLKLAVVGDLSEAMTRSEALAALVRESNRGERICFVPSVEAFFERL